MESGWVRHSGGTATSQRVDSPRTPLLCGLELFLLARCNTAVYISSTHRLPCTPPALGAVVGKDTFPPFRNDVGGTHAHTHEDALRAPGARGAKERGVGRVGVGRSGRRQRPGWKWETRGYAGGERSPPPRREMPETRGSCPQPPARCRDTGRLSPASLAVSHPCLGPGSVSRTRTVLPSWGCSSSAKSASAFGAHVLLWVWLCPPGEASPCRLIRTACRFPGGRPRSWGQRIPGMAGSFGPGQRAAEPGLAERGAGICEKNHGILSRKVTALGKTGIRSGRWVCVLTAVQGQQANHLRGSLSFHMCSWRWCPDLARRGMRAGLVPAERRSGGAAVCLMCPVWLVAGGVCRHVSPPACRVAVWFRAARMGWGVGSVSPVFAVILPHANVFS